MAWETSLKPPPGMGLASLTVWLDANSGNIRSSWAAYFGQKESDLDAKRKAYGNWQNTWSPMKWEGSQWATRSAGQQAGMDELAAQMRGWNPKSAENMAAGNDYAAGLAGMTSEQYSALLANWAKRFEDPNYAADQDALSAIKYQETIANSDFAKEQDQANRIALRQMEEQMGKQLESIFGERGGMGGFQAAYELTAQLENTWLQNQAQQHAAVFTQAVAAVNANNGYFSEMITQGKIAASDYLQFRYGQLKDGFDNYVTMMAQTRADFELQYKLSEDERKRIDDNFVAQIDAMEDQLYLEMGGYKNVAEYIDALYDEYLQGPLAREALNDEEQANYMALGQGVLTAGGAIVIGGGPVGWLIGGFLCLIGIGMMALSGLARRY